MTTLRSGLAAAALFAAAAIALAGDVVVLKGGTVIALKGPWTRKGNTAYLTRADGTVLSVSVAEIDRDATAAAKAAQAAPPPPANTQSAAPETPADAARVKEDAPKARVRITDSDVSHPMELPGPAADGKDKDNKKLPVPGAARVEVSTYDQKKEGDSVIVTGKLRNPTQTTVEGLSLTVTILDEKGEPIDAGKAGVSNGEIEPGSEVDFTVKIPVGDRIASSLRFAPTWYQPKPTPPPPSARGKVGQHASSATQPSQGSDNR